MLEQLKRPPVLIAIIVVALLIVGGTAWSFFGSQPAGLPTRALTTEEKANMEWVEGKARESGGDFNKLSAEDQRRMIAMNGPQAPFNLRQIARNLEQKK